MKHKRDGYNPGVWTYCDNELEEGDELVDNWSEVTCDACIGTLEAEEGESW